jgi:chromosome segregation ATPase
MDEQLITTGATVSAGATAIVYLWRQVQASAKRCEDKLDLCHAEHSNAQEQLQVHSVRVGKLEGQLEVLSSK